MRALVFTNAGQFRQAIARIDAARGLPRAGHRNGAPVGPGEDGWTHTYYDGWRTDEQPPRWIIGPLEPQDESIAGNQPAQDVADDIFEQGGTWVRRRIATWGPNGPATFAEHEERTDKPPQANARALRSR